MLLPTTVLAETSREWVDANVESLVELYRHSLITMEEAMETASSPHELRMMITRQGMNF